MEQKKLPNALAVLILGILSIPSCCFYGLGIIFGVIALVLAKKDTELYAKNPDGYDGYGNIKTGKILAIIGIVLNSIYLLLIIVLIATFGRAVLNDPTVLQEAMENAMGK